MVDIVTAGCFIAATWGDAQRKLVFSLWNGSELVEAYCGQQQYWGEWRDHHHWFVVWWSVMLNVIVNWQAEVQQIMDKFCGILPSNYSTEVWICPSLSYTIRFTFSLCMSVSFAHTHLLLSLPLCCSFSYMQTPLQCHSVVTQYFPLIWELLETYVVSVTNL